MKHKTATASSPRKVRPAEKIVNELGRLIQSPDGVKSRAAVNAKRRGGQPRPRKTSLARVLRKGHNSAGDSRQMAELKQELAAARERINFLQKEHDTSVEELQASNEEIQSAQAELSRYSSGLEKLVAERTAFLQKLVEQMEEFSYSISHDLRAPARAMEGYATALLEDYGGKLDATAKHYLESIVRNSSRMDRMIQEILMYSRVSRCEITLKPVELAPLIQDILQQHPEIQRFSSGIEVILAHETVLAHEPSLIQVVSNLLSNACKFVPPNTTPRCKIWAESVNADIRLFIKDNGIGIKPEHQHRLFGVFERVHSGIQFDGNGIGLAIVRKAVERMSGRVGMESDGVNGSLFWIQLGAAESQDDSMTSNAATEAAPKTD